MPFGVYRREMAEVARPTTLPAESAAHLPTCNCMQLPCLCGNTSGLQSAEAAKLLRPSGHWRNRRGPGPWPARQRPPVLTHVNCPHSRSQARPSPPPPLPQWLAQRQALETLRKSTAARREDPKSEKETTAQPRSRHTVGSIFVSSCR